MAEHNVGFHSTEHRLTQSEQLKTVAWSDEAWFLLRLADGGLRMISWTQPGLLPVQAGGSDGDCEMFCGIFWTFYKQNFVPSNGYFVQNMCPYHKAKSVFQWKLQCIYPCRSKGGFMVFLIKWSLGIYQLFSVFHTKKAGFRWFILRWGQNLLGKPWIITRHNLLLLSQRTVWYSYRGSKEKDT